MDQDYFTRLGLGTAQLGNLSRETSDAVAAETVQAAWAAGIRYFDTAPHYGLGLSERRLGSLLSEYPRREYVVSTKVGRLLDLSSNAGRSLDDCGFVVPATHKRRFDFSRDGVMRSVEASLERTGLDRFDVLLLHDPDAAGPEQFAMALHEGAAALIELREQGVVDAVGAGMNAAAPLAELIRRADLDVVMCAGRWTLLDQSAGNELLPLATEHGVGVIVAGVYNSGLLSLHSPDSRATYDYAPTTEKTLERARAIASVCNRFDVALPDAAVAFGARHPAVVSVLVGARGAMQVAEAARRSAATVPSELWAELDSQGLVPLLGSIGSETP